MKKLPYIFPRSEVAGTIQSKLSEIFKEILDGDFRVSIENIENQDLEFIIRSNLTLTNRFVIEWSKSEKKFDTNVTLPHQGIFIIRSDSQNISNMYYWQSLLVDKPGEKIIRKYDDSGEVSLHLRKNINFSRGRYWELPLDNEPTKSELSKIDPKFIQGVNIETGKILFAQEKKDEKEHFLDLVKKYCNRDTKVSEFDEHDIRHKQLLTYPAYFIYQFFNALIKQLIKRLNKEDRKSFTAAVQNQERLPYRLQNIVWESIPSSDRSIKGSLFYFKQLKDLGRLKAFEPLNNIDAVSMLMSFQRSRASDHMPATARQIHQSFKGFIDPIETAESMEVGNTSHLAMGVTTDVMGNLYKDDRQDHYLGYGTALVPFYQHNDAVRVMMGAKNLRQTLPINNSEDPWIKTGHEESIIKVVRPIIDSNILPESFNSYKPGIQMLVAYMPWYGLNFEDAIVANSRLRDDDIMTYKKEVSYSEYTKPGFIPCPPDGHNNNTSYDESNHYLLKIGLPLCSGNAIAHFTDKGQTFPVIYDGNEGILTEIKYHMPKYDGFGGLLKWKVLINKPLEIGGKLMGRYGNKGVISTFLSDDKMPRLPNDERLPETLRGKAVDLVLNPHGVISRMNLGQLMETHFGLAKALGNEISGLAGKAFSEIDADQLSEMVTVEGVIDEYGRAKLNLPSGSLTENPVVIGYQYFSRLNHIPSNKAHARRGRGEKDTYNYVTGQPAAGKRQKGGQRIGEMEMWALASHQADKILNEILTVKSSKYDIGNSSENETYMAIIDHLIAMGVKVIANRFVPISQKDIISKKGQQVTSAKARIKKYQGVFHCSNSKCGFQLLDGQYLDSTTYSKRSRQVKLTVGDLITSLGFEYCGIIKNDSDEIVSLKLLDKENIQHEIQVDIEKKKSAIRGFFTLKDQDYIATVRVNIKSSLTEFIKWNAVCNKHKTNHHLISTKYKVGYVSVDGGLCDSGIFGDPFDDIGPGWGYIKLPFEVDTSITDAKLNCIPVLPLKYRYVSSTLLDKTGREHDLTIQYQKLQLLVEKYADDKLKDDAKKTVENSIKYICRNLFQLIEDRLLGSKGKSKYGLVRRHGLGRRVDQSARLVITPDPSLSWDQCSLPLDVLGVLYGNKISDWISNDGFNTKYNRLFNLVFKNDYTFDGSEDIDNEMFTESFWEQFRDIQIAGAGESEELEKLLFDLIHDFLLDHQDLRVLLNRAPTLHKYNFMSFRPRPHTPKDKVLKINPLICKAFGADFDGDEMSIHAIGSDDAIKEAEKLSPTHYNNIYSIADGGPIANYDQDFVLGYYLNTGKTKKEGLEDLIEMSPDEVQDAMTESFRKVTEVGVSFSYLELLRCTIEKDTINRAINHSKPDELNNALEKITDEKLFKISKDKTNPGYGFSIMALSGARGKKQTRQVLASRGFLSPGAVGFKSTEKDFIIPQSLVSGMSEERSFTATLNGRSSMIDKNTNTAEAGYLTRRLVLALWPWYVRKGDCGKGSIVDCRMITEKTMCSGCYGSVKGFDELPDQYPAGLIAAQSIGERGTQLSMQSFHTGESAITLQEVIKIINKGDKNSAQYIKELMEVPAYRNLDLRHFQLLLVAFISTKSKTLEAIWNSSRSTLSALAGPGGHSFLKELKSGTVENPIDLLLTGRN